MLPCDLHPCCRPLIGLLTAVCAEFAHRTKRQREIPGTVRLCYRRVSAAERAQCAFLYVSRRCDVHGTPSRSPVNLHNIWHTRGCCYGVDIFLHRLVVALEQVANIVWAQSSEGRGSISSRASHWGFVLCFRQATMAKVFTPSSRRCSSDIYWQRSRIRLCCFCISCVYTGSRAGLKRLPHVRLLCYHFGIANTNH